MAGSRIEKNIVAFSAFSGFFLDAGSHSPVTSLKHNLSIGNLDYGFLLDEYDGARVDNNQTLGNGRDGFTISSTPGFGSFKSNSAFGNGECGVDGQFNPPQDLFSFYAVDITGGDLRSD